MHKRSGPFLKSLLLISFTLSFIFSSAQSPDSTSGQEGYSSGEENPSDTGHEGEISHAGDLHAEASGADGHDNHSRDFKLGERLYYGLTGSSENPVNCASCHNTDAVDTLNWNPSAVEIAHSSSDLDSTAFAGLLLMPSGKRLSVAHEGIELSAEEILLIRKYLETVGEKGLKPQKPDIHRMVFFLFLVVVFLAAVTDMIFFKSMKYKAVSVLVIMLSFGWGTKMVVQEAIALGRSKNYAPLQPVKFSHAIHAGEDQIDCQYCHHTAEYSKSAGIPSMNLCLNCHTIIRDATRSGRYEIDKIHAAVETGEPIEWIRVHRLPDYVFFSHAQHVGSGKLDCAECHGDVKEMDVIQQVPDLSMGWCLDCHRSRKVQFLENDYYNMTFEELHKEITQGTIDSVLVEDIGGTDCMKCHY